MTAETPAHGAFQLLRRWGCTAFQNGPFWAKKSEPQRTAGTVSITACYVRFVINTDP